MVLGPGDGNPNAYKNQQMKQINKIFSMTRKNQFNLQHQILPIVHFPGV
jgi:hypothetical protein